MWRIFPKLIPIVFVTAVCSAQPLTPRGALDQYFAKSADRQVACSQPVFDVEIDASLPNLNKHATMSGLRMVSQTGQVLYDGLRFTGDSLVKTDVIARFLKADIQPHKEGSGSSVSERNYSFSYQRTADYNGISAYVYRLKPRHKRQGLVKGELWLDASTGDRLRLRGDVVKSPSIFIRSTHLVQDYQTVRECSQPLQLHLIVQTRIAGEADMAVSWHVVDGDPVTSETSNIGSSAQ